MKKSGQIGSLIFKQLVLFSLLFALIPNSGISKTSKVNTDTLHLATYQYADNSRIENLQPLAKLLTDKLETKVVVTSYPNVNAFVKAIIAGQVDIGLISTMGYLLLKNKQEKATMDVRMTLMVPERAREQYRTVFVSPNHSTINSLGDKASLKGIRFMLVSPGSTSGNLIPRSVLAEMGITSLESTFQKVDYSGSHKASLQAILNGQADLAAFGSSEYFDFTNKAENKDKLKLVHITGSIPLGPLLIGKRLNSTTRERIEEILLSLHNQETDVFASIKKGWTEARDAERFIQIDSSYYQDNPAIQ